ncbi:type I-C CRISPR-associated endonuclease Cas1c [Candidatus Chloroploca asiatica]|uniref:CRISPR-associated endonuclease Cas1 n=1 Tax=Candidatus Chloroploca asiatica TaxID=1506545 RepID=A0A2H3KGR5_9CHLR|nr:type I-C CRISPR-associated endonuclease Cas1c [Candidatus Chloroploca asiatica]PDV96934.1 subtype I-C CRISPR-associated endonuclease Cas1 [Candidatus Chloroploca asiatica]
MRELLNTLYVQTQGAVLHLDHDAIRITVEQETKLRLPLLRLTGIVVFGRVTVTPFLIQRCAEDGRNLVWLDRNGRFKARVEGKARGNVLLRRAQHLALSDKKRTLRIARQIVAAKVQNSRQILLRSAREASLAEAKTALSEASQRLAETITRLPDCRTMDELRGSEGDAARTYFSVFGYHIRSDKAHFTMDGRTRRPPRDRANALISFLYALLRAECSASLESVGLDPQVGFLHALRPGRPALALDLMEEFRPIIADRLALTLINRKQVQADDFVELPGGAVHLSDQGRRTVLEAYQKRKEEEVTHRILNQKVPIGLLPYIQARLLARHLRGDLEEYSPFLGR